MESAKYPQIDIEIGYWINDIPYVWAGKKNIEECKRYYLIPYNSFFYKEDGSPTKWIDNYNLSVFDTKKCGNKIFRNFFLAWNNQNSYQLINYLKMKGYDTKVFCNWSLSHRFQNNTVRDSWPFQNTVKSIRDLPNYTVSTSYEIKYNYYPKDDIYSYIKFNNDGGPKISHYKMQGRRPEMQDKTLISHLEGKDIYLYAILDGHGHGGLEISKFFSKAIACELFKLLNITQSESDYPKLIQETFKMVDESFCNLSGGIVTPESFGRNRYMIADDYSAFTKSGGGTCFSGVLITPKTIYTINLGDSRVVIGKKINDEITKIFETKDHDTTNEIEYNYIKKYHPGATLDKLPKKFNPGYKTRILGLMVTRVLGDNYLKIDEKGKYNPIARAMPDVNSIPRNSHSKSKMHIIITCDGVYDNTDIENGEGLLGLYFSHDPSKKSQNISQYICEYAYSQGSSDNISAITIEL